MVFNKAFGILLSAAFCVQPLLGQQQSTLWHGKEREIHYKPDGEDFLLVSGKKRFNRALYGTNTGFRVETGDLPEFALYMPGMGGNMKFGLVRGNQSKWLIDAGNIETRYRPGSMLYTIKDPLLGSGTLKLHVLARAEGEGVIIKAVFEGAAKDLQLLCVYGGATGKKFSREGDIGADPESSFYLKPEYCADNVYEYSKNTFSLFYGKGKMLTEAERKELLQNPEQAKAKGIEGKKELSGIFPAGARLKLADANGQSSPLSLLQSEKSSQPVITALLSPEAGKPLFYLVQNPAVEKITQYKQLEKAFDDAELARKTLAGRVKINTPDAYINNLGAALAVAADGIWESPTYLHGAVAWRMRLNAWRGAYVADALGWHDRAKLHFSSYAKSQVLSPETAPVVMDTALHLARHLEKMGTSVFSSGYISRNPNDNSRPHHYDMNLVFFDQMLTHFQYTGDMTFIREMWPVLKRHLAWEKRNFDRDGDGLYDAYAAIWASDALQYSGGGVTHTSSYNYRANKLAAGLARLLGEDGSMYEKEASKILSAVNKQLWMADRGWYAEFKDLLGLKKLHPSAGLWTIYHAIDSEVPDAFKAYQALRYVDTQIPKIPVLAKGLPQTDLYTISTTNWQPYDWSLNNVALAEVLHTALAYWQGGRPDEAFKLWQSILVESMYLSSSPGGFEQLSFYDAIRGELYRDFADPIGMAARSLVEGLYGIKPDALKDTLTVKPGLPSSWNFASIKLPNVSFAFNREGNFETYTIIPAYAKSMNLKLYLPAFRDKIKSVSVNGVNVRWKNVAQAVGRPMLEIESAQAAQYEVKIVWDGNELEKTVFTKAVEQEMLNYKPSRASLVSTFDPQGAFNQKDGQFYAKAMGHKTVFLQVKQGDFNWWLPVNAEVDEAVKVKVGEIKDDAATIILENSSKELAGKLRINDGKGAFSRDVKLAAQETISVSVPLAVLSSGTNHVKFSYADKEVYAPLVNWEIKPSAKAKWEKLNLSSVFNDQITNIFRNKYLSPRPEGPTLQLPWQGIGNWCYPLTMANIDDTGLRKMAGSDDQIELPNGVPLSTPSLASAKNIVFTSQWDNYPDSVQVPLKGKASHAYLLLAGSTNPMQTRFDNGEVVISYKDGTSDRLVLRNPETWWPIEQDYFTDGFAFTTDHPKPYRLYLKSGIISRTFSDFTTIKGYSNFAIDGGAATVLDLPLNPAKELKELKLKTLANDVVIGLMAVTLHR